MAPAETKVALDAGTLAWEADRRTLATLDPETRDLVESIADYLERTLPLDDDGDLELAAGDEEELDRLRAELAVAEVERDRLDAIVILVERNLGVRLAADDDDGPVPDPARAVAERLQAEREEGVKDATIPSRANTAQRKAMRLLVDGRLELQRRDVKGEHAGLIVARCKGDSGDVYSLGYDPHQRRWRCTCAELRGQCSHLLALKMVAPIHDEGRPTT